MADADNRKHDSIQGEILHEYDGILEADNLLPRWWLATFYGTIFFSAGYWFYYEAYSIGQSPAEQYAAIMEERASQAVEVTDELLAGLSTDSTRVEAGQQLFATNCAVCHGQQGEGNIGPNLTDNAWIHGGLAADVHTTITQGVSTAGMPPWGQTLGPQGVLNVAAYVLSIRNTNVAGRPPQGQVVAEDGSPLPTPTEGAAPTDGAAPAEGAAPADGAAPAPTEGAPAGGPAPTEGAAPAPADGAAPTEAAPAGGTAPAEAPAPAAPPG